VSVLRNRSPGNAVLDAGAGSLRGFTVALVFLAAGCAAVGPDYRRPPVSLPAAFPQPPVAEEAALAVPADWWRLYDDALLDRLVSSGLSRNVDLRLATARIEEAEALLREAGAAFFPLVEGGAGISRARSSTRTGALPPTAQATRSNFQFTASTAFELDFWGRLRRTAEAARAQYVATSYARDVVALTLAAGIARTYFVVRSLDAQILVATETLRAAEESLDIVQRRAKAGLVSDLDVNQADANRAQAAALITDLKRQRAVAVHQLGILSGAPDLEIAPGDLRDLPPPPLPPAGLPSALLERRPDVREAEQALAAATAQIGIAKAAQLPSFSLTAALGAQSRELGTLLASGAGIWSVGVSALGPIFDAGRYAARTAQAEARARQAAAGYERATQTAFREVADALANVRLAAEGEQDLQVRVDQARNALRLATLRYEAGYSAYIEVLDAQRTLNEAQLALVRNHQAYLAYTVDLMNALGGGWVPY
jgi:outer membrane protein, multidrug efflux system